MEKFNRSLALCGIAAAFCFGSCISVTDELNLDKKISLDVQVGSGGLSIPVGSLKEILIDSLIKVGGDNSELEVLEDGLYGFSKEDKIDDVKINIDPVTVKIGSPKIESITTHFDPPTKEDLSFAIPTTSSKLSAGSINLSEINNELPGFELKVQTQKFPITIAGITLPQQYGTITAEREQNIAFKYTLPDDVETLNTIYFGNGSSDKGQLITLNVDLKPIYDVLSNATVSINKLDVEFPDNFTLVKDSNLDNYFNGATISVVNNKLSIASGNVKDLSNNAQKKLPLSFYLSKAEFKGYGHEINFAGAVKYSLELTVTGTTKGTGNMYVDVEMADALQMADFSVDTRKKKIELEEDTVNSSFTINGLDGMKHVSDITFDGDESYIKLSLSDFNIAPFTLGEGSLIRITLSNDLTFDKKDLGAMGHWTSEGNNKNILEINPSNVIGQDILLHVLSLNIDQDVTKMNSSIKLKNSVSYIASIDIPAQKDLHMKDITNLNNADISFSVSGQMVVANAQVSILEIKTDLDKTTSISISEDVDKSLLSLRRIDLKQSAGVKFVLKFNGVPSGINEIMISNLTVQLPDFIKISYSGDPNTFVGDDGHSLIINRVATAQELSDNDSLIISGLKIEGFEFADPHYLDNGKLVLNNKQVKITGSATVPESEINLSGLNDIVVTPRVYFDPIEVKAIDGKVNPDIKSVRESVSLSLGSDVDFLKDASFNLSDPKIAINLKSSVPVPINLDLTLSSKTGDTSVEGIVPDCKTIRLEPCPANELNHTTRIVIGQSVKDHVSGDTMFVRMSRLSELMPKIPDSIMFSLNTSADTTVWHYVDLTRNFAVSGDYEVTIPLSFESVFVTYSDTIKNLGKDLKDISDKIMGSVRAQIKSDSVISTIPLGVNLSAVALDKNFKPVPGITIAPCTVAAGSEEGGVSSLELNLSVAEGALEKLEAIKFTAECDDSDDPDAGSSSIRKGQYIHLKALKLNFPDGVRVDFTEKKDGK
jgi:hypothetical protein